ncbi:MAG TPA: DNA polymerase III subunit beta [Firmicutes bacterium]|nr:DNA polymerase III subunit beta [Bacillota bacterium]
MRFECRRDDLAAGVQTAQKAVSSRTTLPILTGILLEEKNGKLRCVGTDLELSIETYIPAQIQEPGSLLLPARYISDIVRKLPEDHAVIETSETYVATLSSGRAIFKINGMDPSEFPIFPVIDEGIRFSIKGGTLKNLIKYTSFAAALEETRAFLTGVLFDVSSRGINMVATDTFRLALKREECAIELEGEKRVIVPARALNEVMRLIRENDETVEVVLGENQIAFMLGSTTVVSRLIEGQFPNYVQVIPKGYKTRLFVEPDKLLAAVERASLVGKDEFGTVKLVAGGDTLMIKANSPDVGQAFEEIAASKEGEDGEIALRSRYLTDMLKVVDGDKISIELTGTISPACLRKDGSDDYIYLIMPVTNIG